MKFSSITDTRGFTYNTNDKKYHTSDWETDVAFKNLIILKDTTQYITTPYKGYTTTYLNYDYAGGEGYLVSQGTAVKIKWKVEQKRFIFTTENGETLNLNKGKSYVGLTSSNHGGQITFA